MKNKIASYLGFGVLLTWLQLHDHSLYLAMEPYWKDYKDFGFLTAVVVTILMILAWPVILTYIVFDITKWFVLVVYAIIKTLVVR